MTIPFAWTISVVVVAGCFLVLTLISVVIAINFCRKNICQCRKYQNYEKPIKASNKRPPETYTPMQRDDDTRGFSIGSRRDNTQRPLTMQPFDNIQRSGNIPMVENVQRGVPMVHDREYSDINQAQNILMSSQERSGGISSSHVPRF